MQLPQRMLLKFSSFLASVYAVQRCSIVLLTLATAEWIQLSSEGLHLLGVKPSSLLSALMLQARLLQLLDAAAFVNAILRSAWQQILDS